MGLSSYNGLIVMLLFHLCQAQDAAPPSADPEPAPPSLGDVINAVKAAFEQAMHISTDGDVHETLEKTVDEHVPWKTPAEQPPAAENVADHTTEEAAVVRVSEEETAVVTAGGPDAHVSESNEQINEESVHGPAQEAKVSQDKDEEPTRLIEHETLQEVVDSEPVKTVKESEPDVEVDQETVKSGGESVLLEPNGSEASTKKLAEDMEEVESPLHAFDTQNESEREEGGEEVERGVGVPWKPQASEMEKTLETKTIEVTDNSEDVDTKGFQEDVKMLPGSERPGVATESELIQEEKHAGTVFKDVGGVVETEGQLERVHGAEHEEAVSKVETGKMKAETFLEEADLASTRKAAAAETQQEAEVNVDSKGSMKWQEPVITKVEAPDGTAYKVNEVNEILNPVDPFENGQGEPGLVNTVEDLPPTPTLGLGLRESKARAEEPDDSSHSKASGQEAWKVGAIAAAFFLILQTAVTIVYILKCRRKPNSTVRPKKLCARGNGGLEYDATITDTTIPIDEQIGVDDLPEYSQVQEEDVAMTTIPPDSSAKNLSHDLRTSAV